MAQPTHTATTAAVTSPSLDQHSPSSSAFTKAEFRQNERKKMIINSISGAFSGLVVSVSLAPLDVIRTRLIVQRAPLNNPTAMKYTGIMQTARTMIKEEGFRSLYKGLGTTLVGYVPNWTVYFTVYEYSKGFMKQHTDNKTMINLASSCIAGTLTSIITSPVWVVKTRMQTQVGDRGYKSIFDAFSKIIQHEGVAALYRGLIPSLFGLAHVAVQFTLYEQLKEDFVGHNPDIHSLRYFSDIVLASSISKFVASVVAYPHEVLRSRMQDHGHAYSTAGSAAEHAIGEKRPGAYNGVVDAVQRIYKEEGFTAFYKGMGTNLLRVVPAATITILTFELFTRMLSSWWGVKNFTPETKHRTKNNEKI